MTNNQLQALLATTHEQFFRLALFVTGSPDAATKNLVRAAQSVSADEAAPEAALLRALRPKRRNYGRWEPGQAERMRAGVDERQARTLLRFVGQLPPDERLMIGLHYLRGLALEEIAALFDSTVDSFHVLSQFRASAAIALGYAPAEADTAALVHIDRWLDRRLDETESTDLRGLTLADSESRMLRDSMLTARAQLPHVLAGLFSARVPSSMLPQLLASPAPARQAKVRVGARPLAIATLVGSVLALAALIIIVPGLRLEPSGSTAAISASAILESALYRFERAPLQKGVLHERYTVQFDQQQPLTIERWYDYAAPHRLAADVRVANETQARVAVRSNGQGTIQYERGFAFGGQSSSAARRVNYQLTPEQAEQATPVLRSMLMPIGVNGDQRFQPEISTLYLAQAQEQGGTLAGRTNVNGRDAFLIRYTTDMLPTEDAAGQTRQVLLSIDSTLFALLDVTVVAEGSGESVAANPWRAEQIEVLPTVPDSQFALADDEAAESAGVRSFSIPNIPNQMYTSLDAAVRDSQQPLLAPTNLPETMRGFVLNQGHDNVPNYILFYESEFNSVLLLPGNNVRDQNGEWSQELESGSYRYRTRANYDNTRGSLLAQVQRAGDSEPQVNVLLVDPLSSPAEREQRMREIIASLEPVTSENISQFQQLVADARS